MRMTGVLNIFLLGAILLLIFSIIQNSFQFFSIKKRVALIHGRYEKVQQRNQQLKISQQQRQYAYFWQQQIRNKLHLVQKSETVVQIPASIKGNQETDFYLPKDNSYIVSQNKKNNWQNWLKVMGITL